MRCDAFWFLSAAECAERRLVAPLLSCYRVFGRLEATLSVLRSVSGAACVWGHSDVRDADVSDNWGAAMNVLRGARCFTLSA